MESYAIGFTALKGNNNLPASGDLFVYESAAVALNAETRIRVKPDNGGVIILKPGQWFRSPSPVTQWALESFNKTDVIDAVFVIGYGEFGDANTLNKFTLDATLTNNVAVTNTAANRVPVTLDVTQTLNVAGSIVAYTHKYASTAASVAGSVTMLAPATNVNGAILNKFDIIGTSTGSMLLTVLANASAPANSTDGDVLYANYNPTGSPYNWSLDVGKQGQIKVPAGKGIYIYLTAGDGAALKDALFTVL